MTVRSSSAETRQNTHKVSHSHFHHYYDNFCHFHNHYFIATRTEQRTSRNPGESSEEVGEEEEGGGGAAGGPGHHYNDDDNDCDPYDAEDV